MRRREFIALLGGAAVGLPRGARAQQSERIRRIGVLMAYAETDQEAKVRVATLVEELGKLGWREGANIRIETRWATDNVEKINRFAQELVASQPDLIVSSATPTTAALLKVTRALPIVFATVVDPVGSGFVVSLPHPGGNATGFTNLEGSMAGKWVELLKEIAPRVKRAALLVNRATASFAEVYIGPFNAAAAALGIEPIVVPIHEGSELESAIAAHAAAPDGGLVVMPGTFFASRSAELTALAIRHRLPSVYPFRNFAELGGLLSYGNDQADNYRRAAAYVDRILKGARAGDLPVQAPVKFELTVNLKTARVLGLDVPVGLLQRADTVIE